jgi:hypothetical protein
MAADRNEAQPERRLRFDEDLDADFQREWREARELSWEQVEAAWRHGFDSRDRFADRPFEEVTDYLRESWRGMGEPAPWPKVEDIVRSGYERFKGAPFESTTELQDDARSHFVEHTQGGSDFGGGVLGDTPQLGDARPEPESPEG